MRLIFRRAGQGWAYASMREGPVKERETRCCCSYPHPGNIQYADDIISHFCV
jgi:hypothetical protein